MLERVSENPKQTAADLVALGEDASFELIHGVLVEKPWASPVHCRRHTKISSWITRRYDRARSERWPGGWEIRTEEKVQYETTEVFKHDLAGWHRDRAPTNARGLVTVAPDWVCELMSLGHEKRDRVDKLEVLRTARVPHYWIVHPERRELFVHQLCGSGYELVLTATPGEVVRAPPFEAVELRVDVLFGDADDED